MRRSTEQTVRVRALPRQTPTIAAEAYAVTSALVRGRSALYEPDIEAAIRDIAAMAKRWFVGGHRNDPDHTLRVLGTLAERLNAFANDGQAVFYHGVIVQAIADIKARADSRR